MAIHIAEARNVGMPRVPPFVGLIQKALIGGIALASVVVAGHEFSHQTVVITQAVWKTSRSGIEQNRIRIDRRGIHENDFCIKLDGLLCESVNHAHADGLAFLLVVNYRFYHRIRSKSQIARLFRPRKGRGIGRKIAPINTSSVAHVLVHALGPPLIQMDLLGIGEVRTATLNKVPLGTIHFLELLLVVALHATQFKARLHHLIRKHVQAISTSSKAHKGLHIGVPRFHVFVTNGPIHRIAIASGTFKIIVRPALRASCPEQGFTPYVIAPKPAKRLLLDIWLLVLG